MPLGSQNHPKMHWNSMFSHPNTPRCSRNVIFGRIGLAMIFSAAIFPVLNQISSQNGLPKLLGVLTFGLVLGCKTLFLRPLHLFIGFSREISKKYSESFPSDWKSQKIRSKFAWKSYARFANLPKGSYPPLTHLTNPPNQKGAGGGSALPLQLHHLVNGLFKTYINILTTDTANKLPETYNESN